jgi:hypothetical protein
MQQRPPTPPVIQCLPVTLMPGRRPALFVAHPGHELRAYHWVETAKPLVFVLTDGSGSAGVSRLASTTRVLEDLCVARGSIYGRLSDRVLYQALIDGNLALFTELAEELADALLKARVDYVVSDNADAYNPSHDVCRLIASAAVALANGRRSMAMPSFEFSLIGRPDACPEAQRDRAVWLKLSDEALERKLAAARAYPELAREVDSAVDVLGVEAFRTECLRLVGDPVPLEVTAGVPFYEHYGSERVASHAYAQVVRRSHVQAAAIALTATIASQS